MTVMALQDPLSPFWVVETPVMAASVFWDAAMRLATSLTAPLIAGKAFMIARRITLRDEASGSGAASGRGEAMVRARTDARTARNFMVAGVAVKMGGLLKEWVKRMVLSGLLNISGQDWEYINTAYRSDWKEKHDDQAFSHINQVPWPRSTTTWK
jgi:hypothetical protein